MKFTKKSRGVKNEQLGLIWKNILTTTIMKKIFTNQPALI